MPTFRIQGEVTREVVATVEAPDAEEARQRFLRLELGADDNIEDGTVCAVEVIKTMVLVESEAPPLAGEAD